MNSELEKLIEKYRITVNGLADLESGYDQVIKERGFVTLNGLLVSGEENAPAGESAENAVNTETHSPSGEENTPVADPAPVEPTPVVPAPSEGDSSHNEPAAPVPPTPSEPATEQPGVTPVTEGPVSGDTNLGNESAEAHSPSGEVVSGERSTDEIATIVEPVADTEVASGEEEDSSEDSTEGEPAAGGKPKKKKK